jgi:hypothetical protein
LTPTFLRKPPAVFPDTAGVSFCMARQVAMPGLKAMPLLDFLKATANPIAAFLLLVTRH